MYFVYIYFLQIPQRRAICNYRGKSTMAESTLADYDRITSKLEVLRNEIYELRQEKIRSGSTNTDKSALGFDVKEFLSISPTKSLKWVTTTLAPRLKQESNKFPSYFASIKLMAMPAEMVYWTCAGYNRGTKCQSKLHVYERPDWERNQTNHTSRNHMEVRLHCCTLCYDGLGVLSEHRMIDCPWLKESNWIEIRGGAFSQKELQQLENPSSSTKN